jgi:hypothetical protein
MAGAVVVGVLVGLVFPITLIVLALVVDATVLLWFLYGEWHDHWAHRIGHALVAPFTHVHYRRRGHLH